MSDSLQREQAIFDAALELPPAERVAYLDEVTRGDGALRDRLNELLKGYEAGTFLESSTAAVSRRTIEVSETPAEPGEKIGRYKLLQTIGEGGCGVVYMAEQEEPVCRRVALKIIKLGMDTKSVIARFEAERQALALMDHPNIAKVFDAGATETGRPYFVMELVRGMKINEYCDKAKMSIPARLELFIEVCHAVQHAHQKGIIHRDLKPSNILVTINDGVPVPKVIDFGIAKATGGQRLTDKTIFTAFEQFIGTPAYMSPEQVVLTSVDIDTRSDIYALGVLLYELLSGKTPFETKDLLAIGLDEMRRTIREKEPERPSTRLSTLPPNYLSTTAQQRGIDAPKLLSELKDDLDWVVMKCLEKDRSRRYETANGLAIDIQRHLNNEPVSACPPGSLYRFQKLVHRNRLAFTAAMAVVSALVIGLGFSTWMFLKEQQARKRAVASEQNERRLRQEAELRELNTRALQLAGVGAFDAEKARVDALNAQRKLLGDDHPEVAESLRMLAEFLVQRRRFPEAEKALQEALAIRKKNFPQGDPRTALLLQDLISLRDHQGKDDEKEKEALFREAIDIARRFVGRHPDSGPSDVKTLTVPLNNFAVFLANHNRTAEALPYYREAFDADRKTLGDGNQEVGIDAWNLISTMIRMGDIAEAQILVRDAVPANIRFVPGLRGVVAALTEELQTNGRYEDAERLLSELISKVPDSVELLSVRAECLARAARFDAASSDYLRLIELKPDEWRYWNMRAAILAYTDKEREHRELCRNYLAQCGKTGNPAFLETSAKNALLLPDPGENLAPALKVVDALEILNWNSSDSKGWFRFTEGLGEYRRGRFEKAIDYLQQVVASDSTPRQCEVLAYPVLAMAHYRLRHSEQALVALTNASACEEWSKSKAGIRADPDWLRALVLIREARALIDGSTASTDAKHHDEFDSQRHAKGAN